MLTSTALGFPNREAIVYPNLHIRQSYRDFHSEVQRVARSLMALKVQPGDHVGLWATNLPQWIVLQFATAEIGAVLVNINPAYRAHELAYVLEQADITILFLTDQFKTSHYFEILDEAQDNNSFPRLRQIVSLKESTRPGMLSWIQFLSLATPVSDDLRQARSEAVQPDDVVNIQYTSGTTGFPKGAMLTHRNLLMNAFHVGARLRFTEQDRLCIPVPFYHCFGCVMGTLMCCVYGAAMIVPAEVFDPLATLQTIHDERCTAVYGVPTMFIAELNHPRFSEFDLSSLRTGIMAGSPCPIEVMRAVVEKMHAREITIAYGLTEASPVITQTSADDSLEHRVGTVGRPLPGLEVRIDAETGQAGELLVRGHGVMKGYYKKPTETAQALTPDGWLHTGDVATLTEDGYYRITGRIKDMIIRGGENVYPREIEEYLFTHPAVADVQVVGLPDAKYGEEISAWIKLKADAVLNEDEVKSFCRGQIAHFKVPRYVVFVGEFPTTVTGKVQKFKLREQGVQRFSLDGAARTETA
jgi:fatty-acyl-CoA synthase